MKRISHFTWETPSTPNYTIEKTNELTGDSKQKPAEQCRSSFRFVVWRTNGSAFHPENGQENTQKAESNRSDHKRPAGLENLLKYRESNIGVYSYLVVQ